MSTPDTIAKNVDLQKPPRRLQVVVFDGNPTHNWVELFKDCTLSTGATFRVVQCSWMEVALTYYHRNSGCCLSVAPVRETDGKCERPATMMVKPDFCIVRNQPRGPTPGSDRRSVLYGLLMAGVPAMNTFESMLLALERPVMYGELKKVEDRVGHERFPLIQQTYYSDHKQMVIHPSLPCVAKVSHAHAGMGKIKLDTTDAFRDLATVLALNNDYCTAEPFVPCEYGIRVQKIDDSYRVLKKVFTGSGWKSQFGGADLQEIPLTHKYKLWADECAKCFGGLDMLAVDALCFRKTRLTTNAGDTKAVPAAPAPVAAPLLTEASASGQQSTTTTPTTTTAARPMAQDTSDEFDDVIIELNDTAIGILPAHWKEETKVIRDLAIGKMEKLFANKPASAGASSQTADVKVSVDQKDWSGAVEEDVARRLLRTELQNERNTTAKQNETLQALVLRIAAESRVRRGLIVALALCIAVIAVLAGLLGAK